MPDLFEKILLLKRSDIFSEIATDDLRFVADILEVEQYFSGDRIFEKNDKGDDMYVIISGKVGISLGNNSTKNDLVITMGKGESFGEMNLLDDLPRSASAVVIEDTSVLKLSKMKLRGLIMSYPELSLGMLKSLSLRLRRTTNLISDTPD